MGQCYDDIIGDSGDPLVIDSLPEYRYEKAEYDVEDSQNISKPWWKFW